MPRPLNLFIEPPFQPGDSPPGPWTRRLAYGDPLPPALRGFFGDVAEFALLETSDPASAVYAAATGYLSTRFPGDWVAEPDGALSPDMAAPDPSNLLVYLNPRPFLDLAPSFAARAAQLNSDFPTATPGLFDRYDTSPGVIRGFTYINLDAQALKVALGSALDSLTVPPASTPLERDRRWRLFLEGQADVPVDAGQAIGRAGAPVIPAAVGGQRQVGFAVLGRRGTLDPAHTYDWLRGFVTEEPVLNDWLNLVPVRWPLLGGLGTAQAMQRTAQVVYPFPVLQQFAEENGLTPDQWRQVGNNQKSLYRRRLLQRSGHPLAGDLSPPFRFNDPDWLNLFQLEAVIEHYVNFTDPWSAGGVPTPPTQTEGANPYRRVDLLPQAGAGATVTGSEVTLDAGTNMEGIWPSAVADGQHPRDTLFVEGDVARPSRTYRITAVDAAANRVTLDQAPDLAGAPTTAWRIVARPDLVLIDSFGPRLSGRAATIAATVPEVRVHLGADVNLRRVARHGFDTIEFYGDSSGHVPSRTYRIVRSEPATNSVILTDEPTFVDGQSAWAIPAGVGGVLPALNFDVGINAIRGYDQYDGVLFIVHDGAVRHRIRWSSYTSRNYHPVNQVQLLSSVRGNARYYVSGYRSGDDFRNFCFKVVDEAGVIKGANWWTFGINGLYDGVRENRRYFGAAVEEDTAPAGTDPVDGGPGKTEIRLHYGNTWGATGTGSAGCLVSPLYFDLRSRLIELYQEEYEALHGPETSDAEVVPIAQAHNLAASRALHPRTPAPHWNDKIAGTLWLIRPDERPL